MSGKRAREQFGDDEGSSEHARKVHRGLGQDVADQATDAPVNHPEESVGVVAPTVAADVEEVESDDSDDGADDIQKAKTKALALLNSKMPTLLYKYDPSIYRCYFCRGKKINKWGIRDLVNHVRGISGSHSRSDEERGKHSALEDYIRGNPSFAHALAAAGLVGDN